MPKPFLTFHEQLYLMEERGLTIDIPTEEAIKFLARVSYFHLNQYRFILEKSTDVYREEALFSSLQKIHLQDSKLRHSIFFIISQIEVALRTQLAYYIGEQGGSFSKSLVLLTNNESVVASWQQIFEKPLSQHLVYAKEQGKNINEIEPWIALEGYEFGGLLYLYKALPKGLQTNIQDFFHLESYDLKNTLYALKNLRNITAHNEAIICRYSFLNVSQVSQIVLPEEYNSLKKTGFKEVANIFPDLYPPHRLVKNQPHELLIQELFLPYYKILKYFIEILNLKNEEANTTFTKLTQQYAVILGLKKEWL
ncbi:Abortive infection system protein AbiD/AbiF protein [Candidatus Hepatincola sp. Pdp]